MAEYWGRKCARCRLTRESQLFTECSEMGWVGGFSLTSSISCIGFTIVQFNAKSDVTNVYNPVSHWCNCSNREFIQVGFLTQLANISVCCHQIQKRKSHLRRDQYFLFCGCVCFVVSQVSGVGGDRASETLREETDNSSLWPLQEVLTATNTPCNSLLRT